MNGITYYVVVDIGCLECGESTKIVGIFSDKAKAESLAIGNYSSGQRSLEMFPVTRFDAILPEGFVDHPEAA